jgi:hypothetical protein
MYLTSAPHAWLRPYYIALKADGRLQKLAIPLRFEPCAAPSKVSSRAARRRCASGVPAGKQGILGWLESVTKEKPDAAKEVELWRVPKNTRAISTVKLTASGFHVEVP